MSNTNLHRYSSENIGYLTNRIPYCLSLRSHLQCLLKHGQVVGNELLELSPIHVAPDVDIVHEALNVEGDAVGGGGHQFLQLETTGAHSSHTAQQCCGSGMIYSGSRSSFKCPEFRTGSGTHR